MTFTKAHLSGIIARENGFTKKKSSEIVEQLIEIIKCSLESGDDILVAGFGKFSVKNKKARRGRNPATGSRMTIPAHTVVTFKYSGKLKNRINNISASRGDEVP